MYLFQLQQIQMEPTQTLPVFAVARSDGLELLKELYIAELVTPYEEILESGLTVKKFFRKGGPLEWYVPIDDPTQMFVDIGTKEARTEQLISELRKQLEIEWTAILTNTDSCNTRDELQNIISMKDKNVST